MQSSILVIGLVPRSDFTRFLGELRARYPEAAVTALVGNPELRIENAGVDEYLLWGDFPSRALAAELRRRRFSLFIVAFNREYYHTLTYWKVLLLAAFSRARNVLFCEQARLPTRIAPLSHLGGAPLKVIVAWIALICVQLVRLVTIGLTHLIIFVLGSVLILVLLGIVAVDTGVAVAQLLGRPRRNQAVAR
jgi:hypothetical protein